LWIGTESGLDELNLATGTFKHYPHRPKDPSSLSENTVFSITEDAAGNIWVGTFNQGLNRLDRKKGTFQHYRVEDGLPNNTIFSVMEDQYRNIWVSTNRGISQFNPRTGRFRNFDVRDGLQANEYYLNAAFQNQKGQIYLAGINGFNLFHPDEITENTAIPPVVLTDFKIFNKSVPVGEAQGDECILPTTITECRQITIPYSSSVFSFEFAALNYLHPEKNQYQYRLEGLETDWVQSGARRFVSYTNLDPGTYTFRVRGSNNDGVWNEAGVNLKVVITPPWWKAWWAYVLDVLIAAGLLYLVFRYFLYQERLKNALNLERLESEKLHEIDSLKTRFFANISHEFRTPLTLILGPVEARLAALAAVPDDHPEKRDFKLMHRSARRLLTLINQLLDLSKLEAGSLKLEPTEGNLLGFLKALVYSFSSLAESRHIALRFHSERAALPALFDRDKVEKVVTNLLANALKFTPEGGTVAVTVSTLSTGADGRDPDGPGPRCPAAVHRDHHCRHGHRHPADRLGKIFDRFYQVDASNTRNTVARALAWPSPRNWCTCRRHHPRAERGGQGTQFTVRLPLQEVQGAGEALLAPDDLVPEPTPRRAGAPADAAPLTPQAPPVDLNAPLLLIVEDNEEVRHYIHDVFAANTASGGQERRRRPEKSAGTGAQPGDHRPDDAQDGRHGTVPPPQNRRTHEPHPGGAAHGPRLGGKPPGWPRNRRRRLPHQALPRARTPAQGAQPGGGPAAVARTVCPRGKAGAQGHCHYVGRREVPAGCHRNGGETHVRLRLLGRVAGGRNVDEQDAVVPQAEGPHRPVAQRVHPDHPPEAGGGAAERQERHHHRNRLRGGL
jgi:signal transduction histidine kinase